MVHWSQKHLFKRHLCSNDPQEIGRAMVINQTAILLCKTSEKMHEIDILGYKIDYMSNMIQSHRDNSNQS